MGFASLPLPPRLSVACGSDCVLARSISAGWLCGALFCGRRPSRRHHTHRSDRHEVSMKQGCVRHVCPLFLPQDQFAGIAVPRSGPGHVQRLTCNPRKASGTRNPRHHNVALNFYNVMSWLRCVSFLLSALRHLPPERQPSVLRRRTARVSGSSALVETHVPLRVVLVGCTMQEPRHEYIHYRSHDKKRYAENPADKETAQHVERALATNLHGSGWAYRQDGGWVTKPASH